MSAFWCMPHSIVSPTNGRRAQMLVAEWPSHYRLLRMQLRGLLLAEAACSAVQCSGYTWVEWRVGGGLERIWIDLCYSGRGGEGAIYMLFAYAEVWSPSFSSQLSQFGAERMKSWSRSWSREMGNLHSGAGAVRGGQEIWTDQWWEIQAWDDHKYHKHIIFEKLTQMPVFSCDILGPRIRLFFLDRHMFSSLLCCASNSCLHTPPDPKTENADRVSTCSTKLLSVVNTVPLILIPACKSLISGKNIIRKIQMTNLLIFL